MTTGDGSGRAPTTRPKPRKSTSGDKIEEADRDICHELEPPEILRATSTLSCHRAPLHYYAHANVTESTVATLLGHATHSITSKYIHSLDSVLITAADTVAGYIQGLLDGLEFKQTALACDRTSRKVALDQFMQEAAQAPA